MLSAVGFILVVVMVALMISGKISLPPILVILPIVAALICGFGMPEIAKFVSAGLSKILNTAVLFTFAIVYFSALSEVGMFDFLVGKVMKVMGNKISLVLLMTCLVTTISHLDCSGATTMLVTIPMMLPLFKKMKLNPVLLVLYASMVSGVVNMLPWSSAIARVSAATGVDAYALWQSLLPVQILGVAICYISCFPVGKILTNKGFGMTDAEFAEERAKLATPEIKVSKGILYFDLILTLVLVVALLTGKINTNVGFMLALAIALPVNFRTPKEQTAQIKKHGANALNMVMIVMTIGVFVGVMDGTGMMAAMTQTLIGLIPESMGSHVVFIVSLVSVPLAMIIGSDAMYMIVTPIVAEIAVTFGGTIMGAAAASTIGACTAAALTLVGASPYLMLGLADVTMGEHLKKNFVPTWALGIAMAVFAAVMGVYSF